MDAQHTTTLGPEQGSIVVRTYREGPAAKAGHDLVIDVTGWQAKVSLGGDPLVTSVVFDVDPRSLVVREGVGGVKPLSDDDRGRIRSTMDGKVLHGHTISFRSDRVLADADRIVIEGNLTLAGQTRPLRATFQLDDDGAIRGTVPVAQTTWGIKPQTAMMGQLRVRDEVEIEIEARLPTS